MSGIHVAVKRRHEGSLGDKSVLYLDGTDLHIPSVTLYYCSQDVTIGGIWVKRTGVSPFYFLQLHMNLQLSPIF